MATNRSITFGLRRDIPSNVEETRTIPFILSTFTRDRHGTVLNQDNWKLENYRKNPLVGYQHNLSGGLFKAPDPDYIIGKDLNPHIEGTGSTKLLAGLVQFEPASINPMAEKIFRKVLFGSLSQSSVAFLEVGQGKYGEGKEARGREAETYYFEGQELLEWSIVNIPSNPDAGKRSVRFLREESRGVQMYAFLELGAIFQKNQIENMSVPDILTLLEAKDLGCKEKDPVKVRKILDDRAARMEAVKNLG